MVERLAKELDASGEASVQNLEVPPDDRAWGEVFRLVGSNAMRGAVQEHFSVKMAFQNCCKVGLFRPDATEEYERFVSPQAQLLNQRPDLLNCRSDRTRAAPPGSPGGAVLLFRVDRERVFELELVGRE
ncbi:hypothetical protein SAMN05216377_11523 [Pseudonocardia oroxyli]|uniref:Uncharacterized protein n=1 Tax=Pseudonocardia oroxyli TaxID=366584 RepID=A0A1G7X049_PSEOR|nr:SCO5389 family protein [Pseudonocardia oroxyli]SDG76930.1 hypothetical protein SAMN05216377_11523 [Pseudonocardia oroxyli]